MPRPQGVTKTLILDILVRTESIRAKKKELNEDEKAIFADAKAKGLDNKTLKRVLKLRAQDPSERDEEEALLDVYLSAIGLKRELPLFEAVGLMKVGLAAQEQVIEAYKQIVPLHGEVTLTMGGARIRLWRDEKGEAHAEEIIELAGMTVKEALKTETVEEVRSAAAKAFDEGKEAATTKPGAVNPYRKGDERRMEWTRGYQTALEPA